MGFNVNKTPEYEHSNRDKITTEKVRDEARDRKKNARQKNFIYGNIHDNSNVTSNKLSKRPNG